MVSKRTRYKNTALILIVSLGVAIILGGIPYVGPSLGAVMLVLGWFIAAPLYLGWYSRRTSETETTAEIANISTPTKGHTNPPKTSTELDSTKDPMETLKQQYAAGELSESEFERRLEILLGVDDLNLDEVVSNESRDISMERKGREG